MQLAVWLVFESSLVDARSVARYVRERGPSSGLMLDIHAIMVPVAFLVSLVREWPPAWRWGEMKEQMAGIPCIGRHAGES